MHCEENLWKLTLVGTINNIGQFVGVPISAWVSDKYGRRVALVIGMVGYGIAGTLRAFTTSYYWFIFFEFIDAAFCLGTYLCAYILGRYPTFRIFLVDTKCLEYFRDILRRNLKYFRWTPQIFQTVFL